MPVTEAAKSNLSLFYDIDIVEAEEQQEAKKTSKMQRSMALKMVSD